MVASSKFSLFPIDPMKTEASKGETACMLSSSRSRDLLLRFSGRFSPDEGEEANGSDSDEIELGLSLGGCFNSANNHKNRILRTSSIPAILPCEALPLFPLFRTCSLPEEEIQSMARMETKRKRQLEEGPVLKSKRFEAKNEGSWVRGGGPANGVSPPVASRWIAGAGQPSTLVKGIKPASQASAASEGSNSSGGSELESRAGQGFELLGFSHASEFRSPSRFTTISEYNYHKSHPFSPFSVTPVSKPTINGIAIGNGILSNETLLRKNNGERCSNGSGELSKSMMKEMPLVSTKGDGLNGQRIEGFLYKYGRGEEVRIVCVCHGSFLTPAEFVKHAGGGDVAHPLRHIVVNPSPAALL